MTGRFLNFCPAMLVRKTADPQVRMAQILYTTLPTIILDGEEDWLTGFLKFPLTKIIKTGLLTAVVSPCVANGYFNGIPGNRIWMALQAERVIGPEALPVDAQGGFTLYDGRQGTIAATYPAVLSVPDWEVEAGTWKVNAVEAKGSVEMQ